MIQFGIDICTALEICESRRIIQRDVKPSNIFVNDHGDYNLGDFGVSRVQADLDDLTKAGTPKFMAPEIYKDQVKAKDIRAAVKVGIYSLGLTMYWVCNSRRTPFEPVDKATLTPADGSQAFRRRMDGEAIPPPA